METKADGFTDGTLQQYALCSRPEKVDQKIRERSVLVGNEKKNGFSDGTLGFG